MKRVIYDIETFPNVFTLTCVFENGKGLRTFEISDRKNDLEPMLDFLRKVNSHKMQMVGFNNLNFDYPVIHNILVKSRDCRRKNKKLILTAQEIYSWVEDMFASDNPYKSVKEEEVMIPQVDLFKIYHFDNKAKMTSLKALEVRMLSDNVEDLPFPVGKELTSDEIDVLITYNIHDVLQTLKFYNYSLEAIKIREELSEKFGFDCMNFNDTKIGSELFIRSLEKEKPGSCYINTPRGKQIRQTKRKQIVIKDCLFKYIKFELPEFKAVHEWFKQQVITETKGVFSDLLEHQLLDVAKYADMVVKRRKINNPTDKKDKRYVPTEEHIESLRNEQPMGWIEEKELKSPKGAISYYWCYNLAETMNVMIDGFRYDFGVGGLHGAKRGVHVSDDKKIIRTLDVASYYPNMAISNLVYPEHLDKTFCKVYKNLYDERSRHPKGTAINAALKLALNGTYGNSNNEFSPFYDSKYTMTITIGGQLSLCMLIEKLIIHCDAEILMCNTDGFEYKIDRKHIEKADSLVKEWESVTKLQMEGDTYSKMMIRDVNNYIAVYESGKVKRKGAYEYEGLGWHQDQSALVITKAVEHELLGRGSVSEFINKHDNKYDFLLMTKVPRSSRLVIVIDGIDHPAQNICRYYPCSDGGHLIKIMPPLEKGGEERRMAIDKDYTVKICNDISLFDWDVNYDYYINEARKLVDEIVRPIV